MRPTNSALLACSLIASTLLISCGEEQPLPPPASRPVKTMLVGGVSAVDTRQFPGTVDAIQKAELAFRVDGKLKEILVKEGELVKQGQVLARLDPTDYQIVLNDRKATFATAEANYERAKKLVEKGAISRVDHDKIRADYFTAKASLDAAEQNLEYTTLKATFPGYIAKRYVENYEEVSKKQAIFMLQDLSELEISIDVPESLMIQLRKSTDAVNKGRTARKMFAVFDQIKDMEFPLTLKEVSTTADVNTSTFKVTLKMKHPNNYNILPGMTATVFAEVFADERGGEVTVNLPISAVVSDPEKNPRVWVVDQDTMTVSPRPVKADMLSSSGISVSGLDAGELVVTAGAAFLSDGMKVTLLQTGEQPAEQPE
jgi:RND family efflux transporter MFP subunit